MGTGNYILMIYWITNDKGKDRGNELLGRVLDSPSAFSSWNIVKIMSPLWRFTLFQIVPVGPFPVRFQCNRPQQECQNTQFIAICPLLDCIDCMDCYVAPSDPCPALKPWTVNKWLSELDHWGMEEGSLAGLYPFFPALYFVHRQPYPSTEGSYLVRHFDDTAPSLLQGAPIRSWLYLISIRKVV